MDLTKQQLDAWRQRELSDRRQYDRQQKIDELQRQIATIEHRERQQAGLPPTDPAHPSPRVRELLGRTPDGRAMLAAIDQGK
jgi:hypothetical protein